MCDEANMKRTFYHLQDHDMEEAADVVRCFDHIPHAPESLAS